ncbi:MAG: InlB B-repeat-containing protein [Lachnospiraceae bacterium]|nr:InlB B-repeat-containing protein [Lachnospiraceae bacterium]
MKRKGMNRWVKGLAVCMLVIAGLIGLKAASVAAANSDAIVQQIRNTYGTTLSKSGRSSFNGYCGLYVNLQLQVLGINSSYVGGNGNDEFDNYKNLKTSSGGYAIHAYPASSYNLQSALNAISGNGTKDVYNILIGFEKGSGEDGALYGHTCFIHAILGGTVYYSESYNATIGGTYYKEGTPIACSIGTFCGYYNSWATLDGVIHFGGNEPDPITWEKITAGDYYIVNVALGDSKQLDVQDGADYNGCNVGMYTKNDSAAQTWNISGNDSARYLIKPKCATRVLNQHGDLVVSGHNVDLWVNTNDDSQRWCFEKVSGGYIIHCTGNTSCVLDVDENGNVCVCTYKKGNKSQIWKLVPGTHTHKWDNGVSQGVSIEGNQKIEKIKYTCQICGQTKVESKVVATMVTLSFSLNGGTADAPDAIKTESGKTVTIPKSCPRRTGFYFLGWAENSSATAATLKGGDSINVSANKTLYAVWKKITYSVKFDANGGAGMIPKPVTLSYGTTFSVSAVSLVREGYYFMGWSTSKTATTAQYTSKSVITLKSNLVLYAVWKPRTNKITFDANGGTGIVPAVISIVTGKTATVGTASLARDHYYFMGWSTSKTATAGTYKSGSNISVTKDTVLYAVWKPMMYKVTYNLNGGSGTTPVTQSAAYGKSVVVPAASVSRSGYYFLGWSTSKTATKATYKSKSEVKLTGNITLYAVWKKK